MYRPTPAPHPSTNLRNSTKNEYLDHNQQMELFRIIETAETRLSELQGMPEAALDEINHLNRTADRARDAIILGCQGLVVSIVKQYENGGLDREDLVQEGNIGLTKAVVKFEYHRGIRLSTYADYWIRQAVCRALSNQSRAIRIPANQLNLVRKVVKVKKQLAQEIAREPEIWEIADELGLSVKRVEALLKMDLVTHSLDAPVGDADGGSLADIISDSSAADPSCEADAGFCHELLKNALANLTSRERSVIEMRYGSVDGRRQTLDEIGRHHGVTRERIRQIQKSAEGKMRQFQKSKDLGSLALMNKTAADRKRSGENSTPSKGKPAVSSAPPQDAAPPKGMYYLKMRSVENLNHHLWNNNGTWFCNFMIWSHDGGKERVRDSLGTKNVEEARTLRDERMRSFGNTSLHRRTNFQG